MESAHRAKFKCVEKVEDVDELLRLLPPDLIMMALSVEPAVLGRHVAGKESEAGHIKGFDNVGTG